MLLINFDCVIVHKMLKFGFVDKCLLGAKGNLVVFKNDTCLMVHKTFPSIIPILFS